MLCIIFSLKEEKKISVDPFVLEFCGRYMNIFLAFGWIEGIFMVKLAILMLSDHPCMFRLTSSSPGYTNYNSLSSFNW